MERAVYKLFFRASTEQNNPISHVLPVRIQMQSSDNPIFTAGDNYIVGDSNQTIDTLGMTWKVCRMVTKL